MSLSESHLLPCGPLDTAWPQDDLVDRLREGDPAAVGAAYDRHHQAVRAFATRLLGDAESAEDLVHDVFVALPGAIPRFRRESSLRTFLIGIAVNQARHHLRGARRRRAAMDRFGEVPKVPPVDPEAEARRRELAHALQRALDKLPLDQRAAFVLCELEERSSAEAAAVLGVPETTVRTRLHHGRKKLRAALEKEGIR
jgi:RNA polymerase sigma-70 factor, ECF subfamily